jgi:bacterioferritin
VNRRELLKLIFGSFASVVVPTKGWTAPVKTDFVYLCRVALSHEYGAIIQYVNHAGAVDSEEVAAVLLKNMEDEIKHARFLVKVILEQTGSLKVPVWPPQVSNNVLNMLRIDSKLETSAIRLYSRILSNSPPSAYRRELEKIFKTEKIHFKRLERLIDEFKEKKD